MKFTAQVRPASHDGLEGYCLYATNAFGPHREYVHLFFIDSPLESKHHSKVYFCPECIDRDGAADIMFKALFAISDARQDAIRQGLDYSWQRLTASFSCAV